MYLEDSYTVYTPVDIHQRNFGNSISLFQMYIVYNVHVHVHVPYIITRIHAKIEPVNKQRIQSKSTGWKTVLNASDFYCIRQKTSLNAHILIRVPQNLLNGTHFGASRHNRDFRRNHPAQLRRSVACAAPAHPS